MNKLISIITINYNGLKDTCELIETLPSDDTSLEVIVVDNGSREDEGAVIANRFPWVTVIKSDRNLGFAGGNNLGIRASHGKYLFFLNNDTLLYIREEQSNVLPKRIDFTPLVERLAYKDTTGMVCPKIRFSWGTHQIQFAGYTPLSRITLRNSTIGYGEEDQGQHDTPHPTPYAHGAAMMVKREVIERVGPMPECYFLYYEELDWSTMITRAGYDIWFEPAVTVYHKESKATGQNSPLKAYYMTRNRLLFVKRNGTGMRKSLSYLYLIGAVLPRDLIKYAAKGKAKHVASTLRGIKDFLLSNY